MKKTIAFLSIIALFFVTTSTTFAISKAEGIYYKTIAITNMEIEQAFGTKGKRVVQSLEKTFMNIRGKRDIKTLEKISNNVKPILTKLQQKDYLSSKERKMKSLAENIYARTTILKDYLLK